MCKHDFAIRLQTQQTWVCLGITFDLFESLLNLWMVGEGFHAYLHSKNKAAICNTPSS